jgi:hypothetical protein
MYWKKGESATHRSWKRAPRRVEPAKWYCEASQHSVPCIPEQNGHAKHLNRTFTRNGKALLTVIEGSTASGQRLCRQHRFCVARYHLCCKTRFQFTQCLERRLTLPTCKYLGARVSTILERQARTRMIQSRRSAW